MSDEPELYPRCTNPECVFGRNRDRKPPLDMIESNVSGTGIDHMVCNVCRREYYVSYKIDKITRIDPDTAEPME